MNNEIKEILYLEKYIDKHKSDEESIINGNRLTTPAMLDYLEVKALLDYITNLQAELQDTKDTLQDRIDYIGHLEELCNKYEEEHNTTFKKWQDDKKFVENRTKEWLDYKSRIEKANEFINENTELEHDGDDYGYMEWINIINMDTMTFINNLSDILNVRSDE